MEEQRAEAEEPAEPPEEQPPPRAAGEGLRRSEGGPPGDQREDGAAHRAAMAVSPRDEGAVLPLALGRPHQVRGGQHQAPKARQCRWRPQPPRRAVELRA